MADAIKNSGTLDFSGGVSSVKVSTIESPNLNPNGLARNQLAKLVNGTMRSGCLSPRSGGVLRGTITLPGPFTIPGTVPTPTPAIQTLTVTTGNWDFPTVIGNSVTIDVSPAYVGNVGDITFAVDLSGANGGYFTITGIGTGPNTITIQLYNKTNFSSDNPIAANDIFNFFLYQQGGTTGPSTTIQPATPYFQGEIIYEPTDGTKPYKIALIGGHVIQYDVDFVYPPIDLSAQFNLLHPVTARGYFCQAEQYLVIQSGDYDPETGSGTLPLIWNGSTLVRSNGLTGNLSVGQANPNVYTVTVTNQAGSNPGMAWTIPAVGAPVYLITSNGYGGNIGDYVSVVLVSGLVAEGNFNVVSFSGTTLVLKNVSGTPGSTVAAGAIQLTCASIGTQTVAVTQNIFPTVVSNNTSGGVPAAGKSITIKFQTAYNYPGPIGDTIGYWRNGTYYGTFQVTAKAQGQLTLLAIAPQHVGGQIDGGTTTWLDLDYLIAPAQGASISVPMMAGYNGSIGDQVTVTDTSSNNWGTYQVAGTGGPIWQPGVTFLAISPNASFVGQFFPTQFTLTVTQVSSKTGTLISQLPAATDMFYYMQRIWYAIGDVVAAGDIVGSLSGTAANNYIDSILSVTQNQLAFGGDGFRMPLHTGNITGLTSPQMINASLGQGLLNIGTLGAIFTLQVPVSEEDWSSATASNQPQINVVQVNNGPVNDWSWVGVNGDLWYQTQAPDIRSLITAVRYFQQWAGVSLSSDESYILNSTVVNRALLFAASGIFFNNRLINTTAPQQTPYGVIHPYLIPLDLEPISTLEEQLPPVWEGHTEGLQVMQLTTALFIGVQRAFAITLSTANPGTFECWEFGVPGVTVDNGNRILWQATLCAFTWYEHGWETEMKKLIGGEMWLDNIEGTVDIKIQYIPDGSSCVYDWYAFSVCNQANPLVPPAYPAIQYQPGIRRPIVFPDPPLANENETGRPSNIGYEFQPIITIHGTCRVRGFFMSAQKVDRSQYDGLNSQ